MDRVIGGLYEIGREIGSGGGGVVYLGRHTRLDKQVALKADKRTLRSGGEALRREVDMLKKLSHTYIPQVYDFVQEDGIVYTVMDYIEGESFDKILDRGQYIPQKDKVRWSCQLLDALAYLHAQGAHGILHGDIKPANIMLRPSGDICLIDFNIALALGEDGAVKVGFSRGYASPEHYGAEYAEAVSASVLRSGSSVSSESMGAGKGSLTDDDSNRTEALAGGDLDRTEAASLDDRTEIITPSHVVWSEPRPTAQPPSGCLSSIVTGSSSRKPVKLDVRSDIYSLGATLYHLYSGRKPAQRAADVVPLTKADCSAQIAAIVKKAMAPDPRDRYQTASEMLDAFLLLRKNDRRVVRRRRSLEAALSVGSALMLAGGGLMFVGLKQNEDHQRALAQAAYSEDALRTGDREKAIEFALSAIPEEKSIFNAPVTAEAQLALSNALGVYRLSDGFYGTKQKELKSAPFKIAVSPEGGRYAAVCAYEVEVFDSMTDKMLAALPTQESALSDCIFAGEDTVIFAGDTGVTAYDIKAGEILWQGKPATALSLSGDGNVVAAVDRGSTDFCFYNAKTGEIISSCSFEGQHLPVVENDIFADPQNYAFALNEDGSWLGVSFSNGALWIADTSGGGGDLILHDESDFVDFDGAFCGDIFLYSAAAADGSSEMGFVDVAEAVYIGGKTSDRPFLIQSDGNQFFVANGGRLESVDAKSFAELELAHVKDAAITSYAVGEEYTAVASDDGMISFYDGGARRMSTERSEAEVDFVGLRGGHAYFANRNDPVIRRMELEYHGDANRMTYNARDIHNEARVSADQNTLMLFRYDRFSIYDNGGLVAEYELPSADQVYDQQFRRESGQSYLEVIWYDGTVRKYSAADGMLLGETKMEEPDRSLLEDLWTEQYHIVSALHEAAKVYERDSEKLIGTLEEEDYLAYVTETKHGLVAEYVTADGERYGYLLDENLGKIAYMPNLCDVYGETVLFDDGSGEIRSSRIYSLDELVQMAHGYGYDGAVHKGR